MNTGKYFILFCLGCLTFLFALLPIFYLSLNNKNEAGRWVSECLVKKSQAALIQDPQLIILSGSSALFGFSAKKLTSDYGIRTVNAAVHAGLGIDYILNYGRKYLKKGRVFVLPLEYEIISRATLTETHYFQVIGYDPEYFTELTVLEKLKFIAGISFATHYRLLTYTLYPDTQRDDLIPTHT